MRALSIVLLVVLHALLPLSVIAQDDTTDAARQWLERMIDATRTLSYEGVFVYIQGQDIDVMTILHSYRDGHERQRMYSLTGPRREVIVDDDQVICVLPDRHYAFEVQRFDRSPFPISFPRKLGKLHEGYTFELLHEERLLDRTTRMVAVRPLDDMRYGYHLWLDNETGLVLRSALVDEQGHYIEQLMFTHIAIGVDIDPDRLLPSPSSQAILRSVSLERKQLPASESAPLWHATELPSGFDQVMHQRHEGGGSPTTEQLVFSDGLATVSVFIEAFDDKPLLVGASSMDAMNTYGVVVDGRYQVIAVGEVPIRAVAAIAASIEPVRN